MMNGKGFERKWSWPNLQHYFSTHLEGMSKITKKKKKNHTHTHTPQSGLPVSGLRFEPGTFQI
jgi:hypothetical protein